MQPQLCQSQPKLLFLADVSGRREKNQTNEILGLSKTAGVSQMNQSFSPLMHVDGDCQFLFMQMQLCLFQPKLLFWALVSGKREKNPTHVILPLPKTVGVCPMNQSLATVMCVVGDHWFLFVQMQLCLSQPKLLFLTQGSSNNLLSFDFQ